MAGEPSKSTTKKDDKGKKPASSTPTVNPSTIVPPRAGDDDVGLPDPEDESSDEEEDKMTLERLSAQIEKVAMKLNSAVKANDNKGALKEVQAMVEKLANKNRNPSRGPAAQVVLPSKVKTGKPPMFTGKANELSAWLTHLKLDFRLQQIEAVESKILYAASWLQGDPNLWFAGILDDYFGSVEDERRSITNRIFDEDEGWVNFETEITRMYGERDEQKQAEDRLERLTQTTSAAAYLSAFNRDRYRVNWDESALKHRFYRGLKPDVKDELCKLDRYAYDFDDYANEAVKIDSRLFERRMEEKGKYREHRYLGRPPKNEKVRGYGRQISPSTSYGTHSGPMDVGMVQKGQQGRQQQHRPQARDKSQIKCFNCDKMGHYAKECNQKKKVGWKPVPEGKNVRFTSTEDVTVRMVNSEDNDWMNDLPDDYDNNYEDDDEESQEAQVLTAEEIRARFGGIEGLMDALEQESSDSGEAREVQVDEDRLSAQSSPTSGEPPEVQVAEDRLRAGVTSARSEEGTTEQDPDNHWIWPEEAKEHYVLARGGDGMGGPPGYPSTLTPNPLPDDAPQSNPDHDLHNLVHWTSCVYDGCRRHFPQKLLFNAFPEQLGDSIPDVTMDRQFQTMYDLETEDWLVKDDTPNWDKKRGEDVFGPGTVVKKVLRVSPTTPEECRKGTLWWPSCPDPTCAKHLRDKLDDWHRTRDRLQEKKAEEKRRQQEYRRIREEKREEKRKMLEGWLEEFQEVELLPRQSPQRQQGGRPARRRVAEELLAEAERIVAKERKRRRRAARRQAYQQYRLGNGYGPSLRAENQ